MTTVRDGVRGICQCLSQMREGVGHMSTSRECVKLEYCGQWVGLLCDHFIVVFIQFLEMAIDNTMV